jgi:YaiO family outer membrane protein
MKPLHHLFLFFSLLVPMISFASDSSPDAANVVEAGFSHDTLGNNYSNWDSRYIDGSHRIGERHTVYGELRETQRFNLQDLEISGGYYYPLSETWTALVGASVSPDHHVLPKDSVFGQLQKAFDGGWDAQAEWHRSQYTTISTDLIALTAERYWGNFRAAYKLYLGKPQGIGAASSHTGQLGYYYGERDYFTLGFAKGRQVESLGSGLGVLTTYVTSTSLSGHHWMDSSWGLSYEAIVEHQGNLYLRKGIRFGLLHSF